jgi:hypothetical protein
LYFDFNLHFRIDVSTVLKYTLYPIYTQIKPLPVLVCQRLHDKVFDYPFFNQGVPLCRENNEFIEVGQVNLNVERDLLPLSGFIFHTSHCGSTLLAKMLASSNRVRVVSEPEAINGLLLSYLYYDIPKPEVLRWLEHIVSMFLQKAAAEEERVILKLSSWNILFIDLFLEVWQNVPWLYLDRKEEEVIHSMEASNSGFTEWWDHAGRVLVGKIFKDSDRIPSKRHFLEKMLHKKRSVARKHSKSKQALFLDYTELISALEGQILPHFNLKFSAQEVEDSLEQTKWYSKSIVPKRYKN